MLCCGSKNAGKNNRNVFEPGTDIMEKGISLDTIKQECLSKDKLFVDSSFPPTYSSLYEKGSIPDKSLIRWKRPKEIVKKGTQPFFIQKEMDYKDLDQGVLPDCWFVASVASVAMHEKSLLEKVVPLDQDFGQEYVGAFHFNFWHYGQWKVVIIDDFLPTIKGRLIYGHNKKEPNEFWGALLEKAYAKLQGSYQALNGGKMLTALTDLTGGISEYHKIMDKLKIPPNLYELIQDTRKMYSVIGASIYKEKNSVFRETKRENGLFEGHAYSITKVAQLELNNKVHNLLRLRNPWGKGEWTGPWSDTSYEMKNLSADKKKELELVKENDGEFWMSYDDFIKNFDALTFCHIHPDGVLKEVENNLDRDVWHLTTHHSCWVKGVSAGGCGNSGYEEEYWKNPQFVVVLSQKDKNSEECTMIISLIEEETKKAKIAINFDVYKLHYPVNSKLTRANVRKMATKQQRSNDVYRYDREVTYHYKLPVAYYVIIASTFNPDQVANFMLRVYTKETISTSEDMKDEGSVQELEFEAIYSAHAKEQLMAAREIKQFLTHIFFREYKQRISFNLETSRNLLAMFDQNNSGHLTMDEMKECWVKVKEYATVFMQTDTDNSGFLETDELSKLLKKLGYEDQESLLKILKIKYGGLQNIFTFIDFIQIICKLNLVMVLYNKQKESSSEVVVLNLGQLIEACMIY